LQAAGAAAVLFVLAQTQVVLLYRLSQFEEMSIHGDSVQAMCPALVILYGFSSFSEMREC
jgi:hypothetical protein